MTEIFSQILAYQHQQRYLHKSVKAAIFQAGIYKYLSIAMINNKNFHP